MSELNIWWSNNIKAGYWFLTKEYTTFVFKEGKFWNYRIQIGDEIVYHIRNAQYSKRKEAVASAKDCLSNGKFISHYDQKQE